MGLFFIALSFLAAGAAFAQDGNTNGDTAGTGRFEYAMVALDEPSLVAGAPRIRIYYGDGKVEDFAKGSGWSGREGTIRDLTVSAFNYLAEKGYELFRTLENDRGADESIRHRYLLRRRK